MTSSQASADRNMAERFKSDTANHQMTVLHDDGLYRHLRFKAPNTGFYWFDLITWPGYLAFTGDMDGYVFARIQDMFEFFRMSRHGINPHYWAEKVTSGRDGIKTYDPDLFERLVKDRFVDAVRDGSAPRGLGKAVREQILDDPDIYHEQSARQILDTFQYKGFRFHDTWEWELRDWDWSYLWACHAIQWGIAQYDAARVQMAGEPA